MKLSDLKPLKKGGAKKAAETFSRDRKKEPSDRLVQIISEYGEESDSKKKDQKDDRAAKDAEV